MNLKQQRAAALKAATDIIAKAKAEDRELTEVEVTEIEAKHAEVEGFDKQIKGAALVDSVLSLGTVETKGDEEEAASKAVDLADHVVKSIGPELKSLRGSRGAVVAPEYVKLATDTVTSPASLAPAYTDVDTNMVIGNRRRLTVSDLLGVETISGSAITYFIEGALEGDFTTVAENAQKPQMHYGNPTAVTAALKKIAAFIKESDEILEDLPWYASAVRTRLLYNLGLFEENQLLSGDGTGTNLLGLLNRVGIQGEVAADNTDNADALFRAATEIQVNSGLEADGIVIHPTDYQNLRLRKDLNDQYYGGGYFAGQYGNAGIAMQPPLWGLQTVVTPAIGVGTALVGAFKQSSSVIRKGGVRVESTNTDEDDFTNNRVTIRAEERIELAVRMPAALDKVTLSNVAPV